MACRPLRLLHGHGLVWHWQHGTGQRHVGDDLRGLRRAAVAYRRRCVLPACGRGVRWCEEHCPRLRNPCSFHGLALCRRLHGDPCVQCLVHHSRTEAHRHLGILARSGRWRFRWLGRDACRPLRHCPRTVFQRVGSWFGTYCGSRRTDAQPCASGSWVLSSCRASSPIPTSTILTEPHSPRWHSPRYHISARRCLPLAC